MVATKAIAVDVGVGQIRAALVSKDQTNVQFLRVDSSLGGAALKIAPTLQRIQTLVNQVLEDASQDWKDIAGLGIVLPGPVHANGTMGPSVNLQAWNGIQIPPLLQPYFPSLDPQRVVLVNDANSAAWGEVVYGLGRRIRDVTLVYFAVRGGVGAGIVIDGRLHIGEIGSAGEWGHVIVDPEAPYKCPVCGQKGCLETLASGDAIAARAVELFSSGKLHRVQESALARGPQDPMTATMDVGGYALFSLPQVAGGLTHAVWATDVISADQQGDSDAHKIVEDAGTALGKAITQALQILNPSHIIIGGVVNNSVTYRGAADKWVTDHVLFQVRNCANIGAEAFPGTNSLLGAAALVFSLPINQE